MSERFNKKRVRCWRRDVWRAFEQAGFKPPQMSAALVFGAVTEFGTDPDVLSELTGLSTDYVRTVLKRLRAQRVLVGQTLRAPKEVQGKEELGREVGIVLDAMVACGECVRGVDPKRSAAQKARAPETRARGARRRRTIVTPGAVFTPKLAKSNPLYGLAEWDQK